MDVASLGLQIDSSQIKEANLELKSMAPAATAAERAMKRWGMTTDDGTKSAENFSKRVQATIRSLEFERAQLTRNAAEQQKFAALRKAGVSASSAEGAAIMAAVAALQAQQASSQRAIQIQTGMARAANDSAGAFSMLGRALLPLAAALSAASIAQAIWRAGMKAADIEEQAEQVGVSANALQAWRLAAAQAGIETEQLDQMFVKLQRSMGTANDGNKEMIEKFQKLGVSILDSNKELRAAEDVMPELAAGLLKVSSQTERNALMMEFLGKSGTKANTMLKEFAKGSDDAVEAAKRMGAIASKETIENWDQLSDKLKVAGVVAGTLMATLGAPVAGAAAKELDNVAGSLGRITTALNNLPKDASVWDRLNALFGGRGFGGAQPMGVDPALVKDALARKAQEEAARTAAAHGPGSHAARLAKERADAATAAADAALGSRSLDAARAAELWRLQNEGIAPAMGKPSGGGGSPVAKGGSSTDPYKTAMESARDYIAAKNAERAALGQTAFEAARLKHETELLNKATSEGKPITSAQTAALKEQAVAMAQADAALAGAKFMDDFKTKAEEFIAQQQIERETLFMSTEAAMAYRLEQEAINAAKQAGIELGPQHIEIIRQTAAAQAEAAEKTRKAKEWVDFYRQTFSEFFSDLSRDLRQGQNIWQAFANAAVNALQKIADKLLQMATDKAFDWLWSIGSAAIQGAAGGIGGGAGGGFSFGAGGTGSIGGIANGAAFQAGNIVPFARGGVVSSPMLFPMSRGRTGMMGEAGPEGIFPLRRGRGGRLGVEASGVMPRIFIEVSADSEWVRATARDESGRVVAKSAPQIVRTAVDQAGDEVVPRVERHRQQAQGEWRG